MLTSFYQKVGSKEMTPALVTKAAQAYRMYQPLLHNRLFQKYKVPLFDEPHPPVPPPKQVKTGSGFFCKGKQYTYKVKPFDLPLNDRWGMVSPDSKKRNSYADVSHAEFELRGKKYLEDRLKYPSKPAAFTLAGSINVVTAEPLTHLALNLPPIKKWIEENSAAVESFFIYSWMIPGPPHLSNITLYYRSLPRGEDTAFDLCYDRFCDGDDVLRNTKFKFKPQIKESPMLVAASIKTFGAERPCLIGNKLTCHYHRGKNYMEVNCDIGSSVVARNVAGVCVRQGGSAMVVDCAFLVEGHTAAELPERLIGGCRFRNIEVDDVQIDFTDVDKPKRMVRSS